MREEPEGGALPVRAAAKGTTPKSTLHKRRFISPAKALCYINRLANIPANTVL